MRNKILALVLGTAAWAAPAFAQNAPLLLPPAVEKDLAARASDVTEVTGVGAVMPGASVMREPVI